MSVSPNPDDGTEAACFFDSHAHLDRHSFGDDLDAVIRRAFDSGVTGIVTIGAGADPAVMEEAAELARAHPAIWAAVGVHPHEADKATGKSFSTLEGLLSEPRVVALGEVGLDFHYDFSSREAQRNVFRRQVETACAAGVPLVVHCREAHEECLSLLSDADLPEKPGVIHCFTGDLITARRYVALGFQISIPGVVTFKNAGPLVGAVEGLLSERLLVETDSPYLAPIPWRGRRNEPAFVRHTVEVVAGIKGLSTGDMARITELNARRLFGLDTAEGMQPRLVYAIRDSLYVNLGNRCTLHCTFCGKFRDFVVKGHNLRVGRDPSVSSMVAAMEAEDLESWDEVVFCGYGEPLLRPDAVKELAAVVKGRGVKVRINTDGLANLVHGRDVVGELEGMVDRLSVSLNAADAATYVRYCRSRYGEKAFEAVCAFIRRAKEVVPEVTATVVALPDLDVEACRKLAEDDLGVAFRVRALDDLG